MKKISILLLFVFINILAIGASLEGTIKVENGEDVGVFVYIEDNLKYDISDERGRFFIDDLEEGREYVIVFQKGDLPDYKERFVLKSKLEKIEFTLPYVRRDVKYGVSGRINSKLTQDIFIDLNKENYGIIVKPNTKFQTKLADGSYNATILQDGAYSKDINFEIAKTDKNSIGTYSLEAIDYNTLTVRLNERVQDGVLQLFKDDYLQHSQRINDGNRNISIEPLKEGFYDLVIKAYGKREFKRKVEIKGNSIVDVKLGDLSKFDNLFVNLSPKDLNVSVKLLYDGDLIREVKGKELVILEGLDYTKFYDVVVTSDKHKEAVVQRVTAGDNLDVNLVRDVEGSIIKGYIYPFNSNAQVMLLEKGRILASAETDENGYYELEVDELTSGRKILRVKAEGFEEERINKTFDNQEEIVNDNIALTPILNKLNGKVVFNGISELSNVLVIIEELSIWQFTNENGEYYFKNIPEGTYNVIFKKLGYESKREKLVVKKENEKINITKMNSVGKVIFRSNLAGYKLSLNGKGYNINQKVYEQIVSMGTLEISASKEGYLPISTKIKLTEAGEIRDIIFDFVNREEQNRLVEEKIKKIEEHIKNLEITDAEIELFQLAEMKTLKAFEVEYLEIKDKLKDAKKILFDIDRNIKFEIEKVKQNIFSAEGEKIGYLEKQRKLQNVYKQSIDYLEKMILYHPYTTFRYDIHMLQGDIYNKMGMINSSKNAYEEAEKFVNRRKEY